MTTISLSEIVNKACELKTRKEKVEWLKKNNSKPLRNILKLMYDSSLELNIPNQAPPYTASSSSESHGLLYRETRKLPYFVKGQLGENLSQVRREALFIQMLETVDREDAILLCKMLEQQPLKGLSHSVINEAIGENFVPVPTPSKKESKSTEDGKA